MYTKVSLSKALLKKLNILLNILISPYLIRGVDKDNINPADYICI